MNKYIDTDKAIDISARYIESVMKAMGVDYRYGKQDASLLFATEPSIDLADYVPKDFHDKTCEAMAKRHQEEIADMVSVVRCKECKWHKANGTYQWCGRLDSTARTTADDFCSYGEREDE